MHVTLVTSGFLHPEAADVPGVRRYSTELAHALARRGIHVRVVVPDTNHTTTESEKTVEVVRLKDLRGSIGRLGNIGQASLMSFGSRFIRTSSLLRDTDVVHSTVPLLAIDAIRRLCPVVAFSHHVEQIRSVQDLLTVPFGNSYGSYTYRRADAVVAPSKATAEQLVSRFDISPTKLTVIHHGINTKVFFQEPTPANELAKPGTRTILFVGPMTARKNVLLLVRAFKHLAKFVRGLQLVLVGSGPLESQVNRMARTIQGRVIRHTRLPDEQLRRLYSSADIFVSASLDEGFGFAIAEAMACGTPVVALDTIVSREIVGDAGILVRQATPAALSDEIRKILEDPRLARVLTERARKRVEDQYSWGVAAGEYAQLYKGLLNAREAS